MKLTYYLLGYALFLTGMINAQNVTVVNGAPFEINKRAENMEKVLNMERDDFSILTKKGKKNFRVISLDEKLTMDFSKELELPEVNNKEVKYVDAGQIGDATYFFSQSFDKGGDEFTLFASDLNTDKGTFNKHYEAMAVKDDKFSRFARPFTVVRSMDSSKIMFVSTYPAKRKENARIAVKVTDNELNEIWKNDIIFDQENRDFTALDYLVDNDGNLHMAVRNRLENSEKKEKGAKGRYNVSLFSYFYNDKELKEYEVGFKQEVILSAHLQLNESNEITCTGFYGLKKLFDAGMKGFFFVKIDPKSKNVVASNLSPFDKEFLGQLMNERRAEKGKGLFNYYVRAAYPMADGGMTVVSEYYLYQQIEDQDRNVVKEIWTYGNVLVFFLDAEGNMKTYSILKKNQTCSTKGTAASLLALAGLTMQPGANELAYYGIATMMKGDKLYLLYNENPKNEARLKEGKNPKSVRQKSSVTQLVTFDREGDINSDVLFKSKDKEQGYKMPLMPRYNFKFKEGGMLVVGKRGKNARVTEISVD